MFFLPIPIGVDRKLLGIPYVSYVLAGVSLVVYLASLLMSPEGFHRFVVAGGVVPADLRWYSLVTMQFIHDAPMPLHLLGNMLFLLVFGRHVEDTIGRVWFALLYLFGGVAAAMIQTLTTVLLDPQDVEIPLIGASGAIAALMGVFAVRFYRTRIRVFWVAAVAFLFGRAGVWKPTSLLALGLWGAWELAQALMGLGPHDLEEAGGVAHWAHLGGLAFGAVVAVGAGLHRHAQDMYTREDAYRFFRRGDMKRAADCFAELLRETPDDADMRHKAGVAYELASHPSRAMPHYARAIELYAARGNVMDGARIFRRVARDPWVGQNLDAETFWLVADHLVERRALPEAVEAFAALATTRTGRGVAENAGLRCADLLLEEFRQPAQALEWYRFVRDKGRDSSNVERAARGAAAAERALAGK